MSNESCGHCLYQGAMKQKRILCLVDNKWHDIKETCKYWVEFTSQMNNASRLKMATELSNRIETQKRRAKDIKLRIIFLCIGFILGIITMIIHKLLFPC